jgi:hypothetical protein
LNWSQIASALPDGELRDAMWEALHRSAGGPPPQLRSFRQHRIQAMRSLMQDGRPWPPPAGLGGSVVGLVRALDRDAGRHRYALGSFPPGELVGELGAACAEPGEGRVPLWTEPGGVSTDGYGPRWSPASRRGRARWALAPLGWPGGLGAVERLGAVLGRLRRLPSLAARRAEPIPRDGDPDAYLHPHPGPNKTVLWSGVHPITGDQLLASSWDEPNALGYEQITPLGYLEAIAPVTRRLGTARPRVPWASRFGQ